MPELPEVQTYVDQLKAAGIGGKKIIKAEVLWHRSIAIPKTEEFIKSIKGQTIKKIERRGKYIVFYLSKQTLLVHLRMSGKFSFKNLHHERVRLHLSDGTILHYDDTRKFGKWYLLEDPEEKLSELGIDPLSKDYTRVRFKKLLDEHTGQIKPFLLNQHYIAGLGNIYVDEALWEAKIHPKAQLNQISKKKELYLAIPKVLKRAIANQGTSLGANKGNYMTLKGQRGKHKSVLNVHTQENKPCPRCNTKIKKIIVSQRSTYFCPHCQKES